jgi:SAM-dependent methyltransferase
MDNTRRVAPSFWHTDWLQLAPLSKLIRAQAGRLPKGATIVDLGCGDLPYAALLRGMGLDYRPADIDDDAVAKGKLPIGPDGRVPLPDHSVDAILSAQVLEHVPDLDAYCAEIRRLLKPDGTLILSTHGSWFYHPIPKIIVVGPGPALRWIWKRAGSRWRKCIQSVGLWPPRR